MLCLEKRGLESMHRGEKVFYTNGFLLKYIYIKVFLNLT